MRVLADDCVHCGFCLPACPTYMLWGREADSPRGRIYLMKAGFDGRPPDAETFRRHIDACLGCMACVTACPSGVHYDRLIEHARADVEQQGARSATDRAYRSMLFATLSHPHRLRWIAAALRVAQRLGLQSVFRSSGLAQLLPPRLAALERMAPASTSSEESIASVTPARGERRLRVGLLLGCVQRVFFSKVNAATVRVLAAEGCEVVAPGDQACCGALMLHAGLVDDAKQAARRMLDAFERASNGSSLDHVVINAAGCGSAMKTYGTLLADDPLYADRARAFASRCVDVSELLAALEPRAVRHPMPARVAYHDACHLNHAQGIRRQPRAILESIPGVELREIAESDVCCGSAGIYSLLEPEPATALRDRKVANVRRTDCELLVSSNPGCLLQLSSGLNAAGAPIRTAHLVEVLDASIRNQPL